MGISLVDSVDHEGLHKKTPTLDLKELLLAKKSQEIILL